MERDLYRGERKAEERLPLISLKLDLVDLLEDNALPVSLAYMYEERLEDIVDCQHFFRQIFLGYFSDIVQAFDTLRTNVCGDDYTSLHNPLVLSSVLPAYGMFHSIQILFL